MLLHSHFPVLGMRGSSRAAWTAPLPHIAVELIERDRTAREHALTPGPLSCPSPFIPRPKVPKIRPPLKSYDTGNQPPGEVRMALMAAGAQASCLTCAVRATLDTSKAPLQPSLESIGRDALNTASSSRGRHLVCHSRYRRTIACALSPSRTTPGRVASAMAGRRSP